jgi:hypothetical protein
VWGIGLAGCGGIGTELSLRRLFVIFSLSYFVSDSA